MAKKDSQTAESDFKKLGRYLFFGLLYLLLLIASSGFTIFIYLNELADNHYLLLLINSFWTS